MRMARSGSGENSPKKSFRKVLGKKKKKSFGQMRLSSDREVNTSESVDPNEMTLDINDIDSEL